MDYTGYLFAHFTGEQRDGEQIYFSLSRDGLHWHDLNGGRPVLVSRIGEAGARDPFLLRSPWPEEGGPKYFLIATDFRIEAGKGWQAAVEEGSRDLLVWESDNLTDWAGPKARTVGVEGAGCVWAPEAVYDRERDAILVFWASMVRLEGEREPRQRIYGSYTRDFESFAKPFVFLEKENHVIDSTIISSGGKYYRYSKDETTKRIRVDRSASLRPDSFEELPCEVLDGLFGVEGPEIYKFNDREEWCLIVDRFAEGKGYLPLVTEDLSGGRFRILADGEFDMGQTVKRHGGVMNLTEEEYSRLSDHPVWGGGCLSAEGKNGISLRPIGPSDYELFAGLEVEEGQRGFVAPNIESLVQAAYTPQVYPLGIWRDEVPVGFLLYDYDAELRGWSMSRLMVDKSRQRQGIGREAVKLFLTAFREKYGNRELFTSAEADNDAALALYRELGFRDGEVFTYENGGITYRELRMKLQL